MTRSRDNARDEALGDAFANLGRQPDSDAAGSSPARRRLLEAATAVFADKGYQGATTKQLAKRAGVTEKTLFSHFSSKADLFAAAMGPGLSGMMGAGVVFRDLADTMAAAGTIEERMAALIGNRLEFAADNTALMKTVIQETLLSPHFREEMKKHWAANLLPQFRALVDRAIATGQLREIPADRVLRTMVSATVGYILTRHVLLPELSWDDDEEADALVEILLRGLGRSA
ncbi:MAG: TetR/AcrR family transcriptional regulator [Myxococcota bacterium]